jgi:hypothetical protein
MRTAPLTSSDIPTLPAMALSTRLPTRSAAIAASQARTARGRRSLTARLLVDLGLCVRLACWVAEALLAVRVVLALLGGNPAATFSAFIYGATGPLVAPFADVFQGTQMLYGQSLDATAILAIVVYIILARLGEAALKTLVRL